MTHKPRGGFVLGIVVGLLVGLALALGVALYITKAPIPFINKVPQRTAEMDSAEAERNRNWDPNAPLSGKAGVRASAAASAAAAAAALPPVATAPAGVPPVPMAASAPGRPAAKDPASILAGTPVAPPAGGGATAATAPVMPPLGGKSALDPFVYFVQAGAYSRSEDADQQRARLGLLGQNARITEREQAGRVVYRVRLGPFPTRDEADALLVRMQEQSIEAQIVRVEKP